MRTILYLYVTPHRQNCIMLSGSSSFVNVSKSGGLVSRLRAGWAVLPTCNRRKPCWHFAHCEVLHCHGADSELSFVWQFNWNRLNGLLGYSGIHSHHIIRHATVALQNPSNNECRCAVYRSCRPTREFFVFSTVLDFKRLGPTWNCVTVCWWITKTSNNYSNVCRRTTERKVSIFMNYLWYSIVIRTWSNFIGHFQWFYTGKRRSLLLNLPSKRACSGYKPV